MARLVSGGQHTEAARALLKHAKTAHELRIAQALLLPLEHGLSLAQTAAVIGRSVAVTSKLRMRLAGVLAGTQDSPRSKSALRNRANADIARERDILHEVLGSATSFSAARIAQLKPEIEARLGKTVALSSIYRLLARHGWYKLRVPATEGQRKPLAQWVKK